MKSLLAIIDDKNDLDLSPEVITRLKGDIHRGLIAQLSPEKEAIPFILYALGNSWTNISEQTGIPQSILYATAMYYQWDKKLASLRDKSKEFRPEDMLGDIFNLSLVIIKHGIQEMAKDVLTGEKKVTSFPLFPKNLHGFEKLFTVLEKLKELTGESPKPNQGGTVVNAQNVQINQSVTEVIDVQEDEARKKERELKYKFLRGEV
jgi:hypothetical protein